MIFGIGLPKSGTRSLHQALSILGYKGSHHDVDWRHGLCKMHPQHTNDPRRYIILPSPRAVESLKEVLPTARFICTVRDLESWLYSAMNNWHPRTPKGSRHKPKAILRDLDWHEFLGTLDPTPELLKKIWFEWNFSVDKLFADEPERLLKINICGGEGWPQLCKFLGESRIPSAPFPYVGKAGNG